MVRSFPERDFSLPLSSVTVSKPLPERFGTTASTWTGGPAKAPRIGPQWARFASIREDGALLDGAAALPAMPATAPTAAHPAARAPALIHLVRVMRPVFPVTLGLG